MDLDVVSSWELEPFYDLINSYEKDRDLLSKVRRWLTQRLLQLLILLSHEYRYEIASYDAYFDKKFDVVARALDVIGLSQRNLRKQLKTTMDVFRKWRKRGDLLRERWIAAVERQRADAQARNEQNVDG